MKLAEYKAVYIKSLLNIFSFSLFYHTHHYLPEREREKERDKQKFLWNISSKNKYWYLYNDSLFLIPNIISKTFWWVFFVQKYKKSNENLCYPLIMFSEPEVEDQKTNLVMDYSSLLMFLVTQ